MFDTSKFQQETETTLPEHAIAYFAGGCFWCIEGVMDAQEGVITAIAGYVGGSHPNPSYELVVSGKTDFREAVKVIYDPSKIRYEQLVQIFFYQIDPTDGGGQFADRGFHYSPAVYYTTEEEKHAVEQYIQELEVSKKFDRPIVVKLEPYSTFYEAEAYHQDYAAKNADRYQRYKKGSGRADFIAQNRGDLPVQTAENTGAYTVFTPEKLAHSKAKYTILFFEAEWCSSCKAIKQAIVREGIPADIQIFGVDYDTHLVLRKKYNVVTQTTFVLVDKA
ncbi:MAG: peptide-methionine (S)-S-oxide reductase MsrA [bacterium]|nr:peptide-methionine (S)-S-oxide reductase MsrA [bacterium]